MLVQNLSLHTVRAFDSDLRLLTGFLGSQTPVGSISSSRLEDFLAYLRSGRGVPCKLKSLGRRLTTLKVFFAWLAQEEVIPSDPAAPLIHHRATTPLARILSEQESAQLLAAAERQRQNAKNPDARPYVLLMLLLATGIKKGECMNIALTDIDTSSPEEPSVFIRYERMRQRFKERKLRLPAQFTTALREYLTQYQPKARLFECTARNLEYVLAECSRRAGLPSRLVSFEILRWTCAVRDFKAGMPEDDLRRKLGLSHISWVETLEKLKKLTAPAL
jgi:integrase/recombinase XerD